MTPLFFLGLWFSLLAFGLIAVAIKNWRERRSQTKAPDNLRAVTPQVVTPNGTAQAQPVVATPAVKSTKTAIWSFVFLAGLIIVITALGIWSGEYSSEKNRFKPKAEWTKAETIEISGTPIRVAWPQRATRVSLEPISPILPDPLSHSTRRYYVVRSGNRSFTVSGREEEDFRPIIGKPLTITSLDGRPISLSIKWR